jgi:hypothetical protein
MSNHNYKEVNKLARIEIDIDKLSESYSNQDLLLQQNMSLYNQTNDTTYLENAKQNLTNMHNNIKRLDYHYIELEQLKDVINNNKKIGNIDDILNKIDNDNKIINKLKNDFDNLNAELNFTTTYVTSNYYQYIIFCVITITLLIMVLLSYFYNTNFIYEYIILSLLIVYLLYFLYNLL